MVNRRKTGRKKGKLLGDLMISSHFQNSFEHAGFRTCPPPVDLALHSIARPE
jgi:hypothetical protein